MRMLLASFNKRSSEMEKDTNQRSPKIVNIVSFICLLEPRDRKIIEEITLNLSNSIKQ